MYYYPNMGKYCFKRLPMEVSNYPDILQDKINEMFHRFDFFLVYIDDLLIISNGEWSNHLEKLELTLKNLKEKRLKCNIKNSFSRQPDMEYLGF